jgi:hypothetical protein
MKKFKTTVNEIIDLSKKFEDLNEPNLDNKSISEKMQE